MSILLLTIVVVMLIKEPSAITDICTMCSECDYEVNDGILIMQKRCCSWFPECEKFKLRPGWIPVTERLPEQGQEVIVYDGGVLKPKVYAYLFWDKNFDNWARITHWMPLPEPPKE